MSNQDDDLKAIDNKKIIEFLEKNSTSHECPFCGNSKWGIVNDHDYMLGLVALPKNGNAVFPPDIAPVAAVGCGNCGYIRLHSLSLIVSKS